MVKISSDHDVVEDAKRRVKKQTLIGSNGKPREGWMNDKPGESLEDNAKRLEDFDKNYRIANNQRPQGKK